MRTHLPTILVAVLLVVVALVTVRGDLSGPTRWTPDGLFYQARSLELQGADKAESLQRTFRGPIGAELRRTDPEHSGDPAWTAFHTRFYERRVAVPLAAAAVEPVSGDRALLDVSLAGYVAVVLAVFALLLLRFRLAIAGGVAMATVLLPALTDNSAFPQTDSWGLALETGALVVGALAIRCGGWRWVAPWAALLLVLSFTRDTGWIPIFAMAYLAFRSRSRVSLRLVATGVAAMVPVLMLFTAPTRELLATMLNDTQPNPDGTWGFVAEQYPGAVVDLLQATGGYVKDGAWYTAGYLLAGLAGLFLLGRSNGADELTSMLRAGAVVAAGSVLAMPIFSAFRLELALVPMAAFGLALVAEAVGERAARPSWARVPWLPAERHGAP